MGWVGPPWPWDGWCGWQCYGTGSAWQELKRAWCSHWRGRMGDWLLGACWEMQPSPCMVLSRTMGENFHLNSCLLFHLPVTNSKDLADGTVSFCRWDDLETPCGAVKDFEFTFCLTLVLCTHKPKLCTARTWWDITWSFHVSMMGSYKTWYLCANEMILITQDIAIT